MFFVCLANTQRLLIDSDWCEHCPELTKVLVGLAKQFKIDEPDIAIAKINGGVHNKTMDKFRIEGYPTLLLIRDVRIWEYMGKKCLWTVVNMSACNAFLI